MISFVIVLHYFFSETMMKVTLNRLHVITNEYVQRINFYIYEHNVQVRGKKQQRFKDITCNLFFKFQISYKQTP